MINWDYAMRRASHVSRLEALSPVARISFAAGALYHAYLYARTTQGWSSPNLPLVPLLNQAFAFVWEDLVALWPQRSASESLIAALDGIAPGEDDPSIPGQADLIDGVVQLLSLGSRPKASEISGIASYAYQAIAEVAIPGVKGDEEDFLKAEQESEACLKEIEFQLAYLRAVEILDGGDFRWDNVIAHLPHR